MGSDVEALHLAWSNALLVRQSLEKRLKEAKLEEKMAFEAYEKAKRSHREENNEPEIQPEVHVVQLDDGALPALPPALAPAPAPPPAPIAPRPRRGRKNRVLINDCWTCTDPSQNKKRKVGCTACLPVRKAPVAASPRRVGGARRAPPQQRANS